MAMGMTVTSPGKLNHNGDDALAAGGIDATVGVVGTPTFPSGSSASEALGLVSFVPSSLHFSDYMQGKTFDVDVNVLAGTTPGDYTYFIGVTGGVNSYGWAHSREISL